MDEDDQVAAGDLLPQRPQRRLAQVHAVDVGRQLHHAEAKLAVGALELAEREVEVLQGQRARADEPARMVAGRLGDAVVVAAVEIERRLRDRPSRWG